MAGRDPGGKFTLFDVFVFVGIILGAYTGHLIAGHFWGPVAGFVAILPGAYLGGVLGRFPTALAFQSSNRRLLRAETSLLWQELKGQSFISHFIVAELLSRGESSVALQDHVLATLTSTSGDDQWQAWRTLSLCFPALAQRFGESDPRSAPMDFRSKAEALRAELLMASGTP